MSDGKVSRYGTGHFVGTIAMLAARPDQVARLLDPRLEPAPQALTPPGSHPLYFVLGGHTEVRGTWPVFRWFPITYREAFVAVPFVRFRGYERPFLFMPRLYLDRWWPTQLGIHGFGFPKVQQDIDDAGQDYEVRERSGSRSALWSASMTAVPGGPAISSERMMSGFELPMLGIRRVLGTETELACWMTFRAAPLPPWRMRMEIADPWLVAAGFGGTLDFPAAAPGSPGGAVHLEYDWALSFPTSQFDR